MKCIMKNLFCAWCLVVSIQSVAQQPAVVRTPNGSIVSDTYVRSEEYKAADIEYINNQLKIIYPRAEVLKPATTTYNCHAYAWHISEGGSAVWMGLSTNPTSIYWIDGSYVEVANPVKGAKVSYANDNHSAVVTDEVNVFISKWGAWPLVRHENNYCPYESSRLRYFVRIKLIGPTQVCTEATFTLSNLPAGATVQWGAGGGRLNAVELASGQGTAQATYRATDSGRGSVQVTVSLNGASTTLSQTVWAGAPSAELDVSSDGIARASACLRTDPLDMHAEPPVWQLWNPSQRVNFVEDEDGRCGRVRGAAGDWNIRGTVTLRNGCGEAAGRFSMNGISQTAPCPRQLEQRGSGSNLTVMYTKPIDCPVWPIRGAVAEQPVAIEVYDRMGRLVLRQQGELVGLGHLRPGLYIVRARSGDEVATLTVVRE